MTLYGIFNKKTGNIVGLDKSSEDLSLCCICRTKSDIEALFNEFKDKTDLVIKRFKSVQY